MLYLYNNKYKATSEQQTSSGFSTWRQSQTNWTRTQSVVKNNRALNRGQREGKAKKGRRLCRNIDKPNIPTGANVPEFVWTQPNMLGVKAPQISVYGQFADEDWCDMLKELSLLPRCFKQTTLPSLPWCLCSAVHMVVFLTRM